MTSSPGVYSRNFIPLLLGIFSSRISQFVLYLSGVPCWKEESVVGLLPDFWTGLFVSLDASICVCHLYFVCLEFLSLKMGNVSTIPKQSPLRCVLDKWSDYSWEEGDILLKQRVATLPVRISARGLERVVLGPCAPCTTTLDVLITLWSPVSLVYVRPQDQTWGFI